MLKKVKIGTLVVDLALYPRAEVNSLEVTRLARAIESGAQLPPIVVNKEDNKIVDGVMRYHAMRRSHDDHDKIEVDMMDFETPKDAFLFAVTVNSRHGRSLAPYDMVHCIVKAFDLGIEKKATAEALCIPTAHYDSLVERRTATTGSDGHIIPIKSSFEHLAGTRWNKRKIAVQKRQSGSHHIYFARQLRDAAKEDMLDLNNVSLVIALTELVEILQEKLGLQV